MAFLSSVWSFLSLVIIAWITQRIINHREKRHRIEQTKLGIYMSWMPFLAECYVQARRPKDEPSVPENYLQRQMEILGSLQIMGPMEAMDAFVTFCDLAELGFANDKDFDGQKFHESFTAFNGSLCCEIHGEKQCPIPERPV